MPFSDPAQPLGTPQAFPPLRSPAVDEMPLLGGVKPRQRERLWDLSINLHCSIIGTCLSTADLRSLLAKLGERDAHAATDHALHGRAVARAGRPGEGSKLLHKLLDRRHEREVARFDKAATTSEVRGLWREAVERGEIPGAYWAVLTHPRTDHALVQEAFGEVHMLSHLVGRSVRADLRRLPVLEAELHERDEAITALEARVRTLTEDKVDLARRLAATECQSAPTSVLCEDRDDHLAAQETKIAQLQARLGQAEERAAAVEARRAEIDPAAGVLAQELRLASEREDALRAERDGLQAQLAGTLDDAGAVPGSSLHDRTLLYVGGRPRQVAQVRRLVERLGGALLAHDGGVEESTGLLPGLVARADVVLVPVDCVSHDAAGIVKRCCREAGFPDGVVNIVTGFGETAGARLAAHPDVDKIAFTGSTEVGKLIVQAATGNLKKVSLELGGKSPAIVFPDADLDTAIAGTASAIFFNMGQCCTAGSRLFAHKSIYDRVVEGIQAEAAKLRVGHGIDRETTLAPLVSEEQHRRVTGYINAGRNQGAEVLTGGSVVGNRGYFVAPTVLAQTHRDMTVVREETVAAPCPASAGPFLARGVTPWPSIGGRCSSIVKRVVRLTKVPIAELFRPRIRSSSSDPVPRDPPPRADAR